MSGDVAEASSAAAVETAVRSQRAEGAHLGSPGGDLTGMDGVEPPVDAELARRQSSDHARVGPQVVQLDKNVLLRRFRDLVRLG